MMIVTFAAFKSLSESPNRVLVLPAPSEATWNLGIQESVVRQRNAQGELVFDESMIDSKEPVVTLGYEKMRPEIMALKLGFKLDNQAVTDLLFTGSRVAKASHAAAAAGKEGTGMTADQTTSECSFLDKGVSAPLTRQPFATFNASTATSFAQGANGAMKFSNDIVGKIVTPFFFYPDADAARIVDEPFTYFKVILRGVLQQETVKKVWNLEFPSIQINRQESGQIQFGSGGGQANNVVCRITDFECTPKLTFSTLDTAC